MFLRSIKEKNHYDHTITRINKYRVKNDAPVIPESLLQIKEEPVLMPVYAPSFSSDRSTIFGTEMTSYMEGIRLMRVEVEVIKMITTGVIPKMREEQKSNLMTDLEELNEHRE